MTIDDLVKDRGYGIGDVKSSKTEISVDRDALEHILWAHPEMANIIAGFSDLNKNESKLLVEILDLVIQGEMEGTTISEEEMDHARLEREDFVENHL